MSTKEVVSSSLTTCQRIAINNSDTILAFKFSFKYHTQRCTYQGFCIFRSFDFCTCYSNQASKVYTSVVNQTSDKQYSYRVDSPNHFTLVYWVNMINLHTNVGSRTRTYEAIDLSILQTIPKFVATVLANTNIHVSNLSKSRDTSLEVSLLSFEFILKVGSQRHVAEC